MAKLTTEEIAAKLESTPEWRLHNGDITRTFEFKDFVRAMQFVNMLAQLAEEAGHHPDIDIRWNKVTLSLSTHSEGGLTAKDFDLATRINLIHAVMRTPD